jgi:alpha-galactosidase
MLIGNLFKFRCLLVLLVLLSAFKSVSATVIHYGKAGKIDYNLKTGTFTVSNGSVLLLAQGISEVGYQNTTLRSKNYTQISFAQSVVKDAFGKGI